MARPATELKIEYVDIDVLKFDSANANRMEEAELDRLTKSIAAHGFVQPPVVRREDNLIVGGHWRVTAARRLGHRRVPVVFVEGLSLEEARVLGLALNKVHGDFDAQLLERMLAELSAAPEIDISLTGFSADELAKLMHSLDARDKRDRPETFDVDEALERAQAAPVAKRGDLWLLGDHRLLCGDSTDAGDVARLLGDERAVLMATDPPYLVDYSGGNHPTTKANKGAKTKDKHWDTYEDPEASVAFFASFLRLGLEHLKPNSAIYQWHATRRQALVEQAWREVGLLVHQTIIWRKARGVLTRSHYMWSHEPCFYGWVEGKPPARKPPGGEQTVWELDQVGAQMDIHPTQKPLAIFEKPISFHTEPGDIVYEPFLGSGTQIIAAERLGRRCFAMELEPAYVDVAVMRWESFAGQKARREESA